MATILLIDDNAMNRKFLTTLLQCSNYHILNASDGEEGLSIAREHHPDLIISDIMMPSMDGYEFVYHLRSDPAIAKTKVIFYSAIFFETAAKELAKAIGVCHFIVQPAHSEDILNVIEQVLNDNSPPPLAQPVDKLHTKHHQLISNKLYEETNKLVLLNEELEQRITKKTQLLEEANQALTVLSFHDQLTGLYNRRFLDEILTKGIKRAKRYHKEFAVLLLDIDHYKNINDVFGHEAGDIVLQEVSRCIQHHIRPEDIASRYGGDEFIVVLQDIDSKNALQYAERLRRAIEKLNIHYNQQMIEKLTLSIGVAMYPMHKKTKNTLIKAADTALYKAKNIGRNNVMLYNSLLV